MLFFALFGGAAAFNKITGGADHEGYCYGLCKAEGGWCWLTWDGEQYYVESSTIEGGCSAFDGADADYYCEGANEPGKTAMESGDTGAGGGSSGGGGGLDSVLMELKGGTDVDCGSVCSAVGGSYSGYGMSSSGEVATWACNCGSAGKVNVACVGSPFMECCKDECTAGKCGDAAGGWECPKGGGCPSGACTGDWEEWVAAHNIFRCMHDVPAVIWGEEVYQDCKATFEHQAAMEHSDCYGVPAPAGPAGENLFSASYAGTPLESTQAWYTEFADCGPFPGCDQGATGTVGHFTAMIWNGVREIGCFTNTYNLAACRYKGEDFKSCNTPNYGGHSEGNMHNVFAQVKTYSECKAAVEACGLAVGDAPHSDIDPTTGLWVDNGNIKLPNIKYHLNLSKHIANTGISTSALVAIAGAVLAVAAVGARIHKRGQFAKAQEEAGELLQRADPELLEEVE